MCKRSSHQYTPPGPSLRRACRLCAHLQTRSASVANDWRDANECTCAVCREDAIATLTEDPRLIMRSQQLSS